MKIVQLWQWELPQWQPTSNITNCYLLLITTWLLKTILKAVFSIVFFFFHQKVSLTVEAVYWWQLLTWTEIVTSFQSTKKLQIKNFWNHDCSIIHFFTVKTMSWKTLKHTIKSRGAAKVAPFQFRVRLLCVCVPDVFFCFSR